MLYICLTAISLTLDSFGVGVAYGLKKIKIGPGAKCAMCLISFLLALLSISVGQFLNTFLPTTIGQYISILLLLILGIYMIFSSFQENKNPELLPQKSREVNQKVFNLFFEKLGLSITIIKYPQCGDFDHSNTIDIKEALYIGLALSLDALGAGIGLGISGQSGIFYALLVGIFQYFFITLGIWGGKKLHLSTKMNETVLAVLPGIILIGLAVYRLLCI